MAIVLLNYDMALLPDYAKNLPKNVNIRLAIPYLRSRRFPQPLEGEYDGKICLPVDDEGCHSLAYKNILLP